MDDFRIGDKTVGPQSPCFIVGEVALAHDGSLGAAHAFIDAIASTGANAVKFQTHISDAESTPAEQFRVKVFPQDATRQDYWKRTEFSEDQWRGLKAHAEEKGLTFLSAPFSPQALDLLQRIGIKAWKVGAGETNNLPLLERMLDTGLPILLSTGMSYQKEIDRAVGLAKSRGVPILLFQCTTRYPCPPEHLGLNLIGELARRYAVPVGFSDHSGKVCTGIAANALGACAIEVHVVFSRKCFGPDVSASLTVEELADLVSGIRFLEKAYANPMDKDRETGYLEAARNMFNKSVVAARDIPAGARLGAADLAYKKPGTGIPAAEGGKVVGKVSRHAIGKNSLLSWDDLSDA